MTHVARRGETGGPPIPDELVRSGGCVVAAGRAAYSGHTRNLGLGPVMSDVAGAKHRSTHLGTGLLVAGMAGAASLQPSVSHRSLTQQAIITGASMGLGFLVGSMGGKVADSVADNIPGGGAGAYAAMTGSGASPFTRSTPGHGPERAGR